MPKCPSCPQFTSKNTDTEPEIEIEVDEDGHVSGTVRIVNTCDECGEELEEASFDVDIDCTEAVADHRKAVKKAKSDEDHHIDVEFEGEGRTDRTQDKDRNGKVIKSARYRKRFYGAECTIKVMCSCGDTLTVEAWADETTAGSMDSMV